MKSIGMLTVPPGIANFVSRTLDLRQLKKLPGNGDRGATTDWTLPSAVARTESSTRPSRSGFRDRAIS
jgi:hypothetical protein